MRGRSSFLLAASLTLAAAEAAAEDAPRVYPATEAGFLQECTVRADETGMTEAMRDRFIAECIAGEKVTRGGGDKAK